MRDQIALRGLTVRAHDRVLLQGVDLDLEAGRIIGLVGPSGSGKTLTARSLVGLLRARPGVVAGSLVIRCNGVEYRPYTPLTGRRRDLERAFRPIRGSVIGYLAQNARRALDPVLPVGQQVSTSARYGGNSPDPLPWLRRAGFDHPQHIVAQYPHQLSGGMAQRVTIAQTLARGSRFLLADEPTTGLDPAVARGIMKELKRVAQTGIGVLLITHDLRVLPDVVDDVAVISEGRLVEYRSVLSLRSRGFSSPEGQRLLDASRKVAAGRLG